MRRPLQPIWTCPGLPPTHAHSSPHIHARPPAEPTTTPDQAMKLFTPCLLALAALLGSAAAADTTMLRGAEVRARLD